jgi:hypothetical protein
VRPLGAVSCGGRKTKFHPLPEIKTELPSPCPDRIIPYKKKARNYESLSQVINFFTNLYLKFSGNFCMLNRDVLHTLHNCERRIGDGDKKQTSVSLYIYRISVEIWNLIQSNCAQKRLHALEYFVSPREVFIIIIIIIIIIMFIPEQTTKAQRGIRSIAVLFL